MTPHNIRPLHADDLDALVTVIDATGLFPGAMLHDMTADYRSGTAADQFWWTVDAGTPVAIAPIAVAYAAPEPMTDGTWNLLLIAVHPGCHGQGIGRQLMAHAERTLAARGARLLLVETSGLPDFARTRRFYSALGYRREARIRDFYRAGEDKIVFAKPLSPG